MQQHYGRTGVAQNQPLWRHLARAPNIANLPAELILNGESQYPIASYFLDDATATTLTSRDGTGETMTLADGAAPTLDVASPFGSNTAAKFSGSGGSYESATIANMQITTSDAVIEAVVVMAEANGSVAATRTTGVGWQLTADGSDNFTFTIEDSGGTASSVSASITEAAWYHVAMVINRSGSQQMYVNGAVSGSAVAISGRAGTLLSGLQARIGSRALAALKYSNSILYFRMWLFDDLGSHLHPREMYERYAALAGWVHSHSAGQLEPTTQTRATSSMQLAADGQLHLMGDNSIIVDRVDASSTGYGAYFQRASTGNLALQSQTVNVTWTQTALTTIDVDGRTAPDGTTTMDGMVATADDVAHGIEQSIVVTADAHTYSWYLEAGDMDFARLDNVTDSKSIDIDLTKTAGVPACTIGTTEGSPTNMFVKKVGNDDIGHRCRVGFTTTTTAAAKVFAVYSCEADGDCVFAGDASTVNTWVWGAQVEDSDLWGSYIATTTTAVARSKDLLTYSPVGNVASTRGTFGCRVVTPDYNEGTSRILIAAFNAAKTNSYNVLITSGGTVRANTISTAGSGGVATVAIDTTDGVEHLAYATYETDNLIAYDDATASAADTDIAVPVSVDSVLEVGSSSGFTSVDGHLSECFWYSEIVSIAP
jgi:hypothetical protein